MPEMLQISTSFDTSIVKYLQLNRDIGFKSQNIKRKIIF